MQPARDPLPTVLIVEDEFLVALDLESIAMEAGYLPVGTAPDRATAYAMPVPHIALIDLNLRDGATGAAIARELSRQGARIIYLTANPAQIGEPAPNAIGVVQKPYSAETIRRVLACANSAGPAPAASSDFTPLRLAA